MRELLPPPARQQRERISSLPAPPSSSVPITSFSIQTSKKFPFFHVVKCCRYSSAKLYIQNAVHSKCFYFGRLDGFLGWDTKPAPAPPLDLNVPKTFKELFSCVQWHHSVVYFQVRGRERLLLQSEADRLQHYRHAGRRRLRTRRAGTICSHCPLSTEPKHMITDQRFLFKRTDGRQPSWA